MPLRHEPPTIALEPVGIARDGAGVNDDEPAAAREKVVQVPAVRRIVDVARFLLVEDEDIGLVELSLGGERVGAGRLRAAFVEQRHPFLEEPRIVVRARAVRLRPGADEDPQRVLRRRW